MFCGFGSDDVYTLDAGDIFLGGAGNDHVTGNTNGYGDGDNNGAFYGGDGIDTVGIKNGTFMQ